MKYLIVLPLLLLIGCTNSPKSTMEGSWCFLDSNNPFLYVENNPAIKSHIVERDKLRIIKNGDTYSLEINGKKFIAREDSINGGRGLITRENDTFYYHTPGWNDGLIECFTHGHKEQINQGIRVRCQ